MNKAGALGVHPFEALLPVPEYMPQWPVVACDQYTSQPEYWASVESEAGASPCALRLMLPEIYLEADDVQTRIEAIHENMRRYVDEGILQKHESGFIMVRRTVEGKTRLGMMMALDLEMYDFSDGSQSLIRATEGTIVSRIPPRLRIRENATLEMPHIIVLIDDPGCTVIEPLFAFAAKQKHVYDIALGKGGGRVEGFYVCEGDCEAAIMSLCKLKEAALEHCDAQRQPLLFAVGDGNHSLATAKMHWEQLKARLGGEASASHPARFALVEVENVHDKGIAFEPIHRVVFGVATMDCLTWLCGYMREHNSAVTNFMYQREDVMAEALNAQDKNAHIIPYMIEDACGFLRVEGPSLQLETATLQSALDAYLLEHEATLDYVHGDETVAELGRMRGNIGFFLPPMAKDALFRSVIKDGALPRKMFSMGHASEKRFYLECRNIVDD